jgi:hypothetical protein
MANPRGGRRGHPSPSEKATGKAGQGTQHAANVESTAAATEARPTSRVTAPLVFVGALVVLGGLLMTLSAMAFLSQQDTPTAAQSPEAPVDVLDPVAAEAALRTLQKPGIPMTERLAGFAAWSARQPMGDWMQSVERAQYLASQPLPGDPAARLALQGELAYSLLGAGDNLGAIHQLETMMAGDGVRGAPDDGTLTQASKLLSLAYLRMGEQANCVNTRSVESCLLPIQGKGVHLDQTGSRQAVDQLLALLAKHPDDLGARWLLNIASMTLGVYPDEVPPQWLIPPTVFDSEYPMQRFHEVSAGAGVGVLGRAGGGIAEDFDNDGDLDLMASSMGLRDPLRYFLNNGDGTFSDASSAAGLDGQWGGLYIVQTDYNNDGWLDVFVPRGAWKQAYGEIPNSLLRNNGDGSFTDVTEEAGLLSFYPTQVSVWADYDSDGWLDLFVGNEGGYGLPYRSQLYHNNGDGTFRDLARSAGLDALVFVKGASWGDYDNDGRPDLYLSVFQSDNQLFHNEGRQADGMWTFRDVTAEAGVAAPIDGFSTWFWDYDNDGWLDLFVADYPQVSTGQAALIAASYLGQLPQGYGPTLYHNERDGTFTNVSEASGLTRPTLTMGSNFGDLDNDGFQDIYLATGDPLLETLVPNLAYRNDAGRRFQDVTSAAGLGHIQKGHAVAFGDVDNDGDQDLFTVMGGAFPADLASRLLFENPGNENQWLRLQLVGDRSNRPAIGARVKFTVDAPGGPRDYHALVGTGSSFGANSLWLEQGLGDATALRSVEVTWPAGGPAETFTGVELGAAWQLREGTGSATALPMPAIDLPE